MSEILVRKFEQVILDNETTAGTVIITTGPVKLSATGSFDLEAWNGTSFTAVDTVDAPKRLASAGKYNIIAAGAITLTATPVG